jgi:phosphomannomutase/phosphoglucomutase
LKVVVDAGNGVAGMYVPETLRRLGCDVVELYCESDGHFPNHPANPEDPENMRDLQQFVLSSNADIGFAYDGDGDRLGVVDEKGYIYNADRIVILLSRDLLSRHPESKILVDVKSSDTVIENIIAHGGIPVLWKTGHSLIKRKMHEEGILLAGEFSGHIFPAESYYPIDDAILASCRLLEYLARSQLMLSQLMGQLPEKYSTNVIELPCPEESKLQIVKELADILYGKYDIVDIDGIRITFNGGWALIRASNTGANLTMRFEADSEEKLSEIKQIIYRELRHYPDIVLGN